MTQRIDFRDQISRNKWKSFFLLAVIFLVFVLFGYVISFAFSPGYFFVIMVFSIIFSLSYILISYYNSDKIAIARFKAKKPSKKDYKKYKNLFEGRTLEIG